MLLNRSIYRITIAIFTFSIYVIPIQAQKNNLVEDTISISKKGFGIGAVPVFAFDSDVGLKYGIAANIFHYGTGERYPKYDHSLLLKWYKTTKGGGLSQLVYDSDKLIPNIRLTGEISYISEKFLDFYGFNGYSSYYNHNYISEVNDDYITKVYYKHERKLFRVKADFQGTIRKTNFKWLAGFAHYNTMINNVNIESLNDQLMQDKILPDSATLFEKYVDWNIINDDQKNGGNVNFLKAGLIYDSRDNEANCNSGLWTEALIIIAPSFLGNDYSYSKFLFTHRQYFPLISHKLTFAYRLSYQTKLSGEIPFYMLPYFIDSKRTEDGLGGAKNLRGILRNRVIGDGFAAANIELRRRIFSLKFLKQDFYVSLNTFFDAAMVTKAYEFDLGSVKEGYGFSLEENLKSLNFSNEKPHFSYGIGLYIGMNDNFIISTDLGKAVSKDDGNYGLYIGLDFIF